MLSQEQTERGHRRVFPMASSTLGGIINGTFKPNKPERCMVCIFYIKSSLELGFLGILL